jgi:hypothetical protein
MSSGRFRATCRQLGWRRVSAELTVLGVTVILWLLSIYGSCRAMWFALGPYNVYVLLRTNVDSFSTLMDAFMRALAWSPFNLVCYVVAVLVPFKVIELLLGQVYTRLGWKQMLPVYGTYD